MLAIHINPPEVLAKPIPCQIPNLDTNQDKISFYSLDLLRLFFKGIVGDPASEALDILGLQRDANFHHVLNALPESALVNGIIFKKPSAMLLGSWVMGAVVARAPGA